MGHKESNQTNKNCSMLYLCDCLFFQIPLIKAVEVPGQHRLECGQLSFPQAPTFSLSSFVKDNEDRWASLAISDSDAEKLERNTRDQTARPTWHLERKHRLTASNFGRFMLRKAQVTDKFLNSILKPPKFTSAATSCGTNSKKIAKHINRKKTGNYVHYCGFLLNPKFPFIGASPDGKI